MTPERSPYTAYVPNFYDNNASVFPMFGPSSSTLTRTVPNLKGKELPRAKSNIQESDCSLGRITRRSSVKAGRVINQKPNPHLTRPPGSKISLVISKGGKRG